jgi:pyruvate dehydrogenase E2 component (dihydrolipoamide acetyltransferase)
MGRIVDHGAPTADRSGTAPRMTLSLTFDHRIVDGAPAARFLQEIVGLLETPSPWLLT